MILMEWVQEAIREGKIKKVIMGKDYGDKCLRLSYDELKMLEGTTAWDWLYIPKYDAKEKAKKLNYYFDSPIVGVICD